MTTTELKLRDSGASRGVWQRRVVQQIAGSRVSVYCDGDGDVDGDECLRVGRSVGRGRSNRATADGERCVLFACDCSTRWANRNSQTRAEHELSEAAAEHVRRLGLAVSHTIATTDIKVELIIFIY